MRCFFTYLSRGAARVYTHLQTPFTRFQTPTSQCLDDELDLVAVITYTFNTLFATMLRRYSFPKNQTLKWKYFWGLEMTCQHLECSFSVPSGFQSLHLFFKCTSHIPLPVEARSPLWVSPRKNPFSETRLLRALWCQENKRLKADHDSSSKPPV